MYEIELLVFFLSCVFSVIFLFGWYRALFSAWPEDRNKAARVVMGWLPAVSFAVIVYTLKVLASFDVIDSFFYIIFYIVLGYAWIFLGLTLMTIFFDLSWKDDVLNLSNKAALIAVAGGFLSVTVIYSGSNIGDGPGWWCVVFAGGLGLAAWICFGMIVNLLTDVFERVTVGRDIGCGIRLCFYFIAGGLILGRASAGDWTSAFMTVIEFADGWPILPLTVLMVLIEWYYIQKSKMDSYDDNSNYFGSVFWGLVYIAIAAACIMLVLPPLASNTLYGGAL